MFRELRYFCSEAFKSIAFNIWMTLASVITVTGCLLFLGVFMLFSVNLSYIADQVREDCKLVAFVDSSYSEEATKALASEIQSTPGVTEAELETQDEAFANAKEMLGDAGVSLDGMREDGFLRASYTITVKDLENSAQIADSLRKIEGVQEVREQQDITERVSKVTNAIKIALIVAMIVLALIAVFIISNSIKLAVYAREKEIHIMKYVGATDWYIRWPFIIEGIIVGIIGGAVSFGICLGAYGYIARSATDFLSAFSILKVNQVSFSLFILLLLFGALMGALGSGIAVRQHLKV
ncbi:MAG: permease-like cell division protein FtsX [Clostridia bacterium]|nr:permease-like cell division protein FtsX [Clostridia bacterium]